MKEKGISAGAAIVIVIVIAAVAAGAYFLLGGGGQVTIEDIKSATSLSLKADTTLAGQTSTVTFYGKDLQDPNNFKYRMEGTAAGQQFIFIVNATESKVSLYMAGQWTDFTENFQLYAGLYGATQFEEVENQLSGWTGGEWTYTDPDTGATVKIYDIQLNPSLSDDLFRH